MSGNWFVYDPDRLDQDWPMLVGPFSSKQAAEEYANVTHPDDMSGNTVVLQAVAS